MGKDDTFNDLEDSLSEKCKECFDACVDEYVNGDSPRSQWCILDECEFYEEQE